MHGKVGVYSADEKFWCFKKREAYPFLHKCGLYCSGFDRVARVDGDTDVEFQWHPVLHPHKYTCKIE